MGKKENISAVTFSILFAIVGSLVVALFMVAFPPATSISTWLTEAPVVLQVVFSNNPALGALGFNSPSSLSTLSYEVHIFFDINQGLVSMLDGTPGLFNPGADIDLTTTTDFEDLAAPAADVMEFTDQDRALAADSVSSVLFWNGVVGFVFGASLRLLLTTDLWRDII
jgi:hypothetical protein